MQARSLDTDPEAERVQIEQERFVELHYGRELAAAVRRYLDLRRRQ
jgi:hypothetical protein